MDSPKIIKRRSFTDWLRLRLKWLTEPVGALVARLGIHPNVLTVIGFVGNVLGAAALAAGRISLGGWIILAMGPVDGLDGATARARGQPSPFGAFVDSVTDRYSEAVIYLGLLISFLGQPGDHSQAFVLAFVAFVGSVMVSYVKARAEALGFECNVGLLTRVERYLILAPLLIFDLPMAALWIIAILANVTALQRIWHVRRQWYDKIR
ncbi:MAG: CDP-alcohol phosphatidyltransferase family protein [Chloroflexi bacterium]|nr:CDP-alcohol phosphatidyltransferase family protein [Chloroflexota bacterium]MBI4315980.1 CDP-alcohol phosphatidyltransferase family protein [Chloroflexota bacterium]MBI5290872.1 CDP-alcohol phosphatidyltransferase family protein [Chloroflexota bacterium]